MGVGVGEGVSVGVGVGVGGRGGRGGAMNVKAPEDVTVPESRLLTVTSTSPALAAGVATVISVGVSDVTVPAVLPKVTEAPASKSVPVIVTVVPPLVDPEFGATDAIVGLDGVACITTDAVPRCRGTGEIAVRVYVVSLAAKDRVPLITPVSGLSVHPAGSDGVTEKKGSVTPVTTIGVVLKLRPIVPATD